MAKNKFEKEETTELSTVAPAGAIAVSDDLDFGSFSEDADVRSKDELVLERFRIVQAMTKDKRKDNLQDGQLYGNMSRKGLESAVIVPIHEWKAVVERTGDDTGAFVAEYVEKKPNSGDFGDPTINGYVSQVGVKELHKLETQNGNKLGLTYNVLVAFLDEETGTEVKGLGVLQADKTNIRPYLLWRQNRVDFNGATAAPTYAFRTVVDGKGEYTNPDGKTTQQYRFSPFKNNNWKESLLSPKLHRELLVKLQDQKKMVVQGSLKVAEYSDADDSSEAAQEQAAF